jgi:hypothetical protein
MLFFLLSHEFCLKMMKKTNILKRTCSANNALAISVFGLPFIVAIRANQFLVIHGCQARPRHDGRPALVGYFLHEWFLGTARWA